MVRAALTIGWLVVLPGLAVWLFNPELVAELRINTTPAAAARIHPGMTLAEAEQVVGGPPKDYRRQPVFEFVSGNRWPSTRTWTTRNGKIIVTDGEFGLGPHPVTGQGKSWWTGDGVIDAVRWESVAGDEDSWTELATHAALVYGLFAVIYVCCWMVPRRAAARDAGCPAGPIVPE